MNSLLCITANILKKSLKPFTVEAERNIQRWVRPTQIAISHRKRAERALKEKNSHTYKRSNFLEWNRGAEIYAFNQRLSEKFDAEKLDQAFVHKSYISVEEQKQKEIGINDPSLDIKHNENLIIAGLELISKTVTKYLIQSLPQAPQEAIKAFHDYLLSEEILTKASVAIGTKDLILTEEYPVEEKTLAETFCAVVAALAESVDEDHASFFIRDFLIVGLADKDLNELWCPPQPVEVLNTLLSKQNRSAAEPRIIAQYGVNTIVSAYQIGFYSDKEFLAAGGGQTIAEAKDVAALNSIFKICDLLDTRQPFKFDKPIDISAETKIPYSLG